jgi:SepF-like predicted cell division protein (DUF552 family)
MEKHKELTAELSEEVIKLFDVYPLQIMTADEIKQLIEELRRAANGHAAKVTSLEKTITLLEYYLNEYHK